MDGFIDEAFCTESGKEKSRKIREKMAAKAAKKARDEDNKAAKKAHDEDNKKAEEAAEDGAHKTGVI